MNGLSTMQYFLKLLKDHNYYNWWRLEDGTNHLGEVFFAHPRSVELVRLYPYVLELDATYSTNRYDMPMVEVIGFLPTGKNFHVGFGFIKSEKHDSFFWMMQQVKKLFTSVELPGVFVTDRELALMKAIGDVFDKSTNLLCRRHIAMDVQQKHAKLYGSKEWEYAVKSRWTKIVTAKTEDDYNVYVNELLHAWRYLPRFQKYVNDTWLEPQRQRFVSFWTNKHLHLGATTTNRCVLMFCNTPNICANRL